MHQHVRDVPGLLSDQPSDQIQNRLKARGGVPIRYGQPYEPKAVFYDGASHGCEYRSEPHRRYDDR